MTYSVIFSDPYAKHDMENALATLNAKAEKYERINFMGWALAVAMFLCSLVVLGVFRGYTAGAMTLQFATALSIPPTMFAGHKYYKVGQEEGALKETAKQTLSHPGRELMKSLAVMMKELPQELFLELRPVWEEACKASEILKIDPQDVKALQVIQKRVARVEALRQELRQLEAAEKRDLQAVAVDLSGRPGFRPDEDVDLLEDRRVAIEAGRRRLEAMTYSLQGLPAVSPKTNQREKITRRAKASLFSISL